MNGNEALTYLMERTKQWPEMIIFVNWGSDETTKATTLVAAYSKEITEKADFEKVSSEVGIPGQFFSITERIFTKKGLNQWLKQIQA